MADFKLPSYEELKAMQASQVAPFDQSKFVQQAATGMTLNDVIAMKALERQKQEQDLKKEIEAAIALQKKKQAEAAYAKNVPSRFPSLGEAAKIAPAETAKFELENALQQQKGNEEDTRQRNYVRQLFQTPDGRSWAVLGKVDEKGNPVVVPVGQGGENQPFIKPTLPAEQAEKTGTFNVLSEQLADADTMFDKKFVGPMDSVIQNLKLYTPAADPDFAMFKQNMADIKNQIIYLRSGKQINEAEYKRLMASMPSEYRSDSVFKNQLARFKAVFDEIRQQRLDALRQSGFRNVPQAEQTSAGIPMNSTPTGNAGGIDAVAGILGLKKKGQ